MKAIGLLQKFWQNLPLPNGTFSLSSVLRPPSSVLHPPSSALCSIVSAMHIQLQVPSIVCEMCANNVMNAVLKTDPGAVVKVNLKTKHVDAQTQASESAVKAAIAAVGHTVA
ncbi:MAG: heavy-metal-associated domain-containing protein [Leptolyngbyaceae cyanobacterium RU_5_1]|nr:heavy-metal-associated domain-containing protein [Leptolyngbyaceae cyanobacterium RU_5_1]